jgi:hypothetical protein
MTVCTTGNDSGGITVVRGILVFGMTDLHRVAGNAELGAVGVFQSLVEQNGAADARSEEQKAD